MSFKSPLKTAIEQREGLTLPAEAVPGTFYVVQLGKTHHVERHSWRPRVREGHATWTCDKCGRIVRVALKLPF